jgi:Quinohemoprotein amine dehydrogenase, alpha subunit domain III
MKSESLCPERPNECCIAQRPRYFARQVIMPADMTLEQDYFRDKLRRHNRMLHGWGVVCGTLVCTVPTADCSGFEPWQVVIKPGYILDPCGDEIYIASDHVVDLRAAGVAGISADACGAASDPWCSDVVEPHRAGGKWYVAVKYREFPARPVRVHPAGCGCDDTLCEYSRFCDGYEIGVLACCPAAHQKPPELATLTKGAVPACPPCPSDPWVVLAEVEIDKDGKIISIDNCTCRRLVISFGNFWWQCTGGACKIVRVTGGGELDQGTKNKTIHVAGDNFQPGAAVDLGAGITVGTVTVDSPKKLTFTVSVDSHAAPGPRTLTVLNADCTWCKHEKVITVVPVQKTIREPSQPKKPDRKGSQG